MMSTLCDVYYRHLRRWSASSCWCTDETCKVRSNSSRCAGLFSSTGGHEGFGKAASQTPIASGTARLQVQIHWYVDTLIFLNSDRCITLYVAIWVLTLPCFLLPTISKCQFLVHLHFSLRRLLESMTSTHDVHEENVKLCQTENLTKVWLPESLRLLSCELFELMSWIWQGSHCAYFRAHRVC